ncbi:MAG TPA: hypothetical protein VIG62_21230 [Blastocatellia bacterium]|jgi:hypothetical protein
MDDIKPATIGDPLIQLIKSSLVAGNPPAGGQVVLYTSFGVVRGRTGIHFAQTLSSARDSQGGVIELDDVTVEHYSNHLPTATFSRLYVRLTDVLGFAIT